MHPYDVTWRTQGASSADSMPIGGCDTGCNVWTENDSLYLYVSESGTFDENNTMLKLARLRFWIADEGGFSWTPLVQTRRFAEGDVIVSAGESGNAIRFHIWCAASKPEVHVEFYADRPHDLRCALECWRWREREITKEELHQCRDFIAGAGTGDYPGVRYTYPDTVEYGENELVFFHRNRTGNSAWDVIVEQQKLGPIRDRIPNPLLHRTMGGSLCTAGMERTGTYRGEYSGTDFEAYAYRDAGALRRDFVLTLHTACTPDPEQWKRGLAEKRQLPASFEETAAWWKDLHEKSYIHFPENSEFFAVGRNYQIFRDMLACNFSGEYPTKFNGGLFTFDEGKTPDFRMWSGGGFTAQNQRLVYWGLLKSGDFDGMLPQLDYYRRLTGAAKARTRHFLKHGGAYFNEQGNNFGVCTGAEYGWVRSPEVPDAFEDNPYVRYHLSTALEFALMMLEYHRYTGRDIAPYLDFIDSVVEFYFEEYPRDKDGKLRIFPSTSLETYKRDRTAKKPEEFGCANPIDAIAGLRCVLSALIRFFAGSEKAGRYERMLEQCPELPVGENAEGTPVFLPAEPGSYDPKPFNCELPELYPVFPYSPFGLSEEERRLAGNTYRQKYASERMYYAYSWHQNGIFASRLRILDEAEKYLHAKLDDAPKRFPAFWGPGHDWTPDHNHGGSGMIQLQEMLMQCDGEEILLLPCWDKQKDVSFRLHAPGNTTVECEWEQGTLKHLSVSPPERLRDVRIYGEAPCECSD